MPNLAREVYCILGMPIDAIGMVHVLRCILEAAVNRELYFISTPNLNFLVNFLSDSDFRESLLISDLCPPDGMSIIWIARLIGIPVRCRVAGSDLFEALKTQHNSVKSLRVFLFGGPEGVAAAAAQALNAQQSGLYCVGSLYPGFGSVDELSRDEIIDKINSSHADILVVALGAMKGQLWLLRNYNRLKVPVRTHLGAAINFQAGAVRRSPRIMRTLGLEWLWRIKEEPYLWKRYWIDGKVLFRLLFVSILPIAIWARWMQINSKRFGDDLVCARVDGDNSITVGLSGPAIARHINKIIPIFEKLIMTRKRVIIDFANTRAIDLRFLGFLLVLRKELKISGSTLILIGLRPALKRLFRVNGVEFLLSLEESAPANV